MEKFENTRIGYKGLHRLAVAFVLGFELCNSHALNASAALLTCREGPHVSIGFVVGMSPRAMSGVSKLISPPVVSGVGREAQQSEVIRIDTSRNSANDMISGQTFRNVSDEHVVSNSSGKACSACNLQCAVAFVFCPFPYPTTSLVQFDFFDEGIKDRFATAIYGDFRIFAHGGIKEKPTRLQKVMSALESRNLKTSWKVRDSSLCHIKARDSVAGLRKEST